MQNLILDGTKLAYHKDRVEAWLRGERVAPITIDCSLSTRCTQRCLFCYGQLQTPRFYTLPRDPIMRFLDDAAEIGVKAISFVSDGESTCNPHLYEAILRGKSNGLDMALGTNGYLLRDDKLEDILPALTYLRFNINAADPGRYAYIHGCKEKCFNKVVNTIRECVRIKKKNNLSVTLGLQMVLMPEFADQVLPLAKLGRELGVDYTIVKHCSDDEFGTLGVDYGAYQSLVPLLKEAEGLSTDSYLVKVKWHKIFTGRNRKYSRCYGPPFITQFSGTGLVAPCGMLFNDRYRQRFHIGSLVETSYKEIWKSERYWQVMDELSSDRFDARTDCGSLCLQHYANEFLWDLKKGNIKLEDPTGEPPLHVNFI